MDALTGSAENTITFDLEAVGLREVNRTLHAMVGVTPGTTIRIERPDGRHSVAAGLDAPLQVIIAGHVGYYAAGMNQQAELKIEGSAGTGLAENMMSGRVEVAGNVSQSAGATAHGGLLVVHGDAGARCGISMKGVDIVIGGDVGHLSAFMAQAGRLVVRGDAGEALGDSIYEARLYVRGTVASLGADCVEKPMTDEHRRELGELLVAAGYPDDDLDDYTRYGSARSLYHFHPDHAGAY